MALRSILLLVLLGSLAHGETHKSKIPKIRDLDDMVTNNVILTKFAALVNASNLGTFLSSRGPFTFFVPTNSAFSKLPQGMFDDLLLPQNQTQLQRIILFHLINGQILDAKDLKGMKSLVSCEGNPLPLHTSKSGTQYVMKAKIIHADIKCANGLIHQIDTLLMPPQVVLVSKMAGDAAAALGTPSGGSTNTAPAADVTSPPDTNTPAATAPDQTPATVTNAAPRMNGG